MRTRLACTATRQCRHTLEKRTLSCSPMPRQRNDDISAHKKPGKASSAGSQSFLGEDFAASIPANTLQPRYSASEQKKARELVDTATAEYDLSQIDGSTDRREARPVTRRAQIRSTLKAKDQARAFLYGARGKRKSTSSTIHDWGARPPPKEPPRFVQLGTRSYLPELNLSEPASQLTVVPQETRDGVATGSWWRLAPEPEPLSPEEEAGDYTRWTEPLFKEHAPRVDKDVPSWTEVLERTLPRNRTMTLAQKKLFAKTVETLIAHRGSNPEMLGGKSYAASIEPWPKGVKAMGSEVEQRLPWHPSYRALIAKNV